MKALNPVQMLFRKIQEVGKKETVTKALLSELSRSILSLHFLESEYQHNVMVVNRLLSVLSPANKKVARLFFKAFLPYTFNEETCTFGKLLAKEARREEKMLAMGSFLNVEANDLWSWVEEHVKVEETAPNYQARVANAIKQALKHEVTPAQLLEAMLEGGLDMQAVLGLMTTVEKKAA